MKFSILDILMFVNLAFAFVVTLVIGSTMYMEWRNNQKQEVEE